MSAGLVALKDWVTDALDHCFSSMTVHLYGFGNEEISGGGYAPVPFTEHPKFVFTGETPKIYGYYLMDGSKKIYSEALKRPWHALNAGESLEVEITLAVKVKHG